MTTLMDIIVVILLFSFYGWVPAVAYIALIGALNGVVYYLSYRNWVRQVDHLNGRIING